MNTKLLTFYLFLMRLFEKIGVSLMLSVFISPVFAGNAPENLQILEASDESISLDWDDVDDVIGYYVYYGTHTASWSSYEIEGIDLIDESELILDDLSADTRYYIAFTSVDEFGTESQYSDEVEYVTLMQGSESKAVNFRISDVSVIDETSIELIFSTDLEQWASATREFMIENKKTGVEIGVDISDVLDGKPRSVVVVLWSELEVGAEYKVTVLDISDSIGNTIESWIDAFINFTTPNSFTPDLESAWTEEVVPVIEETPIVVEEVIQEDWNIEENIPAVVWNNAGTNISTTENTLNTAWENTKLPTTGPEHWILACIALFLAGGIYYSLSRKHS